MPAPHCHLLARQLQHFGVLDRLLGRPALQVLLVATFQEVFLLLPEPFVAAPDDLLSIPNTQLLCRFNVRISVGKIFLRAGFCDSLGCQLKLQRGGGCRGLTVSRVTEGDFERQEDLDWIGMGASQLRRRADIGRAWLFLSIF